MSWVGQNLYKILKNVYSFYNVQEWDGQRKVKEVEGRQANGGRRASRGRGEVIGDEETGRGGREKYHKAKLTKFATDQTDQADVWALCVCVFADFDLPGPAGRNLYSYNTGCKRRETKKSKQERKFIPIHVEEIRTRVRKRGKNKETMSATRWNYLNHKRLYVYLCVFYLNKFK